MHVSTLRIVLLSIIIAIFSSIDPPDSSADIVVTGRSSRTFFDVFSGVGPRSNRRRETPPVENDVTSSFAYNFSHVGSEMFDNGSIIGTASAFGNYDHWASIGSSPEFLDVNFYSDMAGEAIQDGDGVAFSDMSAELNLEFFVNVETEYSFDLQFSHTGGDQSRFLLRHIDTGTNLHNVNSQGSWNFDGILAPGAYRLIADTIASDFNADPSFATSSSFRFQAGISAVPEPTSGLLVLLGIGSMAMRRRRKELQPRDQH